MDFSKMQEMLAQAQSLQGAMEQQLEETVVEAQSGGGVVTVRMNGRKEVLRLKILPAAVGSAGSDLELLEDLITAAVNEAGRKADEAVQAGVAGVMGGMTMPGLE